MSSRDEILARIRSALADRPAPAPVPRDYRQAGSMPVDVDLFAERVADYRATVHRCAPGDVETSLTSILQGRGITKIVVAEGFPPQWVPAEGVATVPEPTMIDRDAITMLDTVSAVLTTSALGIAETGTIVLDTGLGQGPRALTLVPDYHLCVVAADRVRAEVPDAMGELDPTAPLTWISGPSATSDIELQRVEGVHGPRTLDVLIVGSR